MPKPTLNLLSAKEVESAKFTGKEQKIFDGGGLFLHVKEAGRYWRIKYRMDGKERLHAIGVYPTVTLAGARKSRDEVKSQLAQGIDPAAQKRAVKAARVASSSNSLEAVAREWYAKVHKKTVKETSHTRNLRRLELYLFPKLGRRPILDIDAPQLLEVLRPLETGSGDTAHRVKNLCSQIWRYAAQTGRVKYDVTTALRGALTPIKQTHFAAVTSSAELGPLLEAMGNYRGESSVKAALMLAPMMLVRPGELRRMEWKDLDLVNGAWDFQPSKGGGAMITPLPRQAVTILKELQPVTGHGRYVFPCRGIASSDKPMSENAVSGALHALGYQGVHTGHGFRATARTLLDEQFGYPIPVIEMALGHAVKDANGRAYNRTSYLEQRREMMQAWADYLDELRASATAAKVVGLP